MIEQRQFGLLYTSCSVYHTSREDNTRMRGRNCDISPGNTINNDYQFHTQAIIIGAVGSLIDTLKTSDFF